MTRGEPYRLTQAGIDSVTDHQPIDHRFDVMRLLRGQFWNFVYRVDDTVDTCSYKAGLLDRFQNIAMSAASAANQRREYHHTRIGRQAADCRLDFGGRLLRDRRVALWAQH